MTTPAGVPNLPVGALTMATLQSKTQDMSVAANRARAGERVPSIFDASNGGNSLNDLTPFGVLTQLFSGFNSVVSRADPADIQGPDDLPGLLLDFIEELPVVGQFVDLLDAFSGTYEGDDQTLLAIQHIVSTLIGADSLFNAANLYGQFGIPITWLNNNVAEGLWNPGFDGPESLVGVKFQWDGTVYRTLSTDRQPGSVRIAADGAVHALRSNAYSLNAGDKLDDIIVRVAWTGLSAATDSKPMRVSLVVTDDTGTQYVDIASVGMSDGVAASGWTGLPPGALDAKLTGDWTATTDCTVVMRLVLEETATAGTIWWDAASMPVIGNGIPTQWLNALVADFAKLQAPFVDLDALFDPVAWATAWGGLLDILGLEQVGNQIIADRDSIWTKLFQQVIPPSTLNLHPDMTAVNDELAIIFNPFDNNDLDRAQAWDDLMGLVGIESHTADSVAWWNNLFAANKTALENQSGVTALSDSMRRSLNWVLGQLGFGYVNTSGVWVSGSPGAGDLPTGSGWSNTGGAPQSWLADILKAFGVPVGNDLPSQLDPSIPAAPVLGWPVGGSSSTTSVPQDTMLYYVATVVDTATLKESAPSNEVMIWSMPSILGSKNQATLSWFVAPPAGKTISLYRRQSTTGQYRRVASGRTGTSYTDTDPGTATTTQPGSAAASAAGVINGQFTVVSENHQVLTKAVKAGADGTDSPAAVTAQEAQDAVAALRGGLSDLQTRVDDLTITTRPGGKLYRAQGQANASDWSPFVLSGSTAAATRTPSGFGWLKSGEVDRMLWGRYPNPLNTDSQMVEMTFGSAISYDGLQGYAESGSDMVYLRGNSALTDMVYLRVWGKSARLYARKAGVDTLLDTINVASVSGDRWSLYCLGNTYTVFRNGVQVSQVVSTLVAADASHRYVGMGQASRGSSVWHSEWVPAVIYTWMARDAAPITVQGVGCIMSGPATPVTSPKFTVSGMSTIRRSCYNATADYQSDDITISAYAVGDVQMDVHVGSEGWYEVVNIVAPRDTAGYVMGAGLLHTTAANTDPRWRYSDLTAPYALSGGSGYGKMSHGGWIEYCEAGDILSPAVVTQANQTFVLADGNTTFSVTKVGSP